MLIHVWGGWGEPRLLDAGQRAGLVAISSSSPLQRSALRVTGKVQFTPAEHVLQKVTLHQCLTGVNTGAPLRVSPGSAGCAVGRDRVLGELSTVFPCTSPPTLVTPAQALFTRSTELGRVGRDEVLHWELWCPGFWLHTHCAKERQAAKAGMHGAGKQHAEVWGVRTVQLGSLVRPRVLLRLGAGMAAGTWWAAQRVSAPLWEPATVAHGKHGQVLPGLHAALCFLLGCEKPERTPSSCSVRRGAPGLCSLCREDGPDVSL